ncbi:GrpB family protein [Vibrio palustris]|uniref:Dephospho-CoA kinase/protein folding accessory domain-containing protein n=1 Tax=Vibrio palustris TaxID=1918946 RepID=A0A1R4B6R1_9VIBR|nr:GrpB family protein [Vibrio palustris]SJL84602.1 hypothetical protein VPAL9027_02593 [Vibrio palustris]
MKFYQPSVYQPQCQQWFTHYKSAIQACLPDARIEHIGASSLPNALSKGDVDIFVGVAPEQLEECVATLSALGFSQKRDTLRTPELCMLEALSEDDVALQVVANGSEYEDFLLFRDALRATPDLVTQYNALKQACVGVSQAEYRKTKSVFIGRVIEQTRENSSR